jgi:hypothetical protein
MFVKVTYVVMVSTQFTFRWITLNMSNSFQLGFRAKYFCNFVIKANSIPFSHERKLILQRIDLWVWMNWFKKANYT